MLGLFNQQNLHFHWNVFNSFCVIIRIGYKYNKIEENSHNSKTKLQLYYCKCWLALSLKDKFYILFALVSVRYLTDSEVMYESIFQGEIVF